MKAKLFLLVALCIVTLPVSAQISKEKPIRIGAGALIGIPTGDAGNAFTFAPGIGYKIADKFDILLKYQSASKDSGTTSFFGLRVGFTF